MNHHKNARTHYYASVLIVERVMQHGQEAGRVAADLGISKRCVHTWLKRYREEGWSGLHNRSSRPRHMPNKTDEQIAATICYLRRTYHMTAMAIAHALQKAYLRRGTYSGEKRPRPGLCLCKRRQTKAL